MKMGRSGAALTGYPSESVVSCNCRSPCPSTGKEVNSMNAVISFVLSVAAGIVSYYICKWLDEQFFMNGKH